MRTTRFRPMFASALALCVAATPVSALAWVQETPWLRPGDEVAGALEEGDAVSPSAWEDEEHRHDDYLIEARAGQRLVASAVSEDFDTYLEIYRDGDQDGDPLAQDDDGGEGLNARLRFVAPDDGRYRLRVRGFWGEAEGPYVLSLDDWPAPPPAPPPTPIAIGGEAQGELTTGGPELDDERPYDAYSFRARRGDRVDIRLNSDAFDPVLHLGVAGEDGAFDILAMNDDSGGGLNSLIRFTAPADGDYVIQATAYSAGSQGPYVLSLAEAPPQARPTPIATGETATGVLDDSAPLDEDGWGHRAYGFTAQAGQRIDISLSSDDFDAYLVLGREGSGGFEALAQDDDGGEGLNARLVHTFQEAGDYVIHARSFMGAGEGDFTLSVAEPEPDPEPEALAFGQTVEGRLTDGSALSDDSYRFDAYRFEGREGQRVQAVMRSGDFDAYLILGRDETPFEEIARDDDGLGEHLNARLIHTLPADGAYVVRATSFGGRGTGLYSLELTDRGPAPAPGSLMIGATVRGTLGETGNVAADGSYYDVYRFRAEAGDRLRITMVSNEFDAYLRLGEDVDGEFRALASDDDGLSGTDARIDHVFEDGGWYEIWANSYAPGSVGDYVVNIERRE